jgi:hypothetical protein
MSAAHVQPTKSVNIRIRPGILKALLDVGTYYGGDEALDRALMTVVVPQDLVPRLVDRLAAVLIPTNEDEAQEVSAGATLLCRLISDGATTCGSSKLNASQFSMQETSSPDSSALYSVVYDSS